MHYAKNGELNTLLRYKTLTQKTAALTGNGFCIQRLSLNGDVFIGLHCRFCFLLRNIQGQNTMFELTLNILLGQIVTNIEATLAGTCITDVYKRQFETILKMKEAGILYEAESTEGRAAALNNGQVASVVNAPWFISSIKQAEDQSGLWRAVRILSLIHSSALSGIQ